MDGASAFAAAAAGATASGVASVVVTVVVVPDAHADVTVVVRVGMLVCDGRSLRSEPAQLI